MTATWPLRCPRCRSFRRSYHDGCGSSFGGHPEAVLQDAHSGRRQEADLPRSRLLLGGRIVELHSPSTVWNDRTVEKDLYARVFRTSKYLLCDPDRRRLEASAWCRREATGRFSPTTRDDSGASSWACSSAPVRATRDGRRIGSGFSVSTGACCQRSRGRAAAGRRDGGRVG